MSYFEYPYVISKKIEVPDNKKTGELFKHVRRSLDISQDFVSKKTGVSKQTVSVLEKGNTNWYDLLADRIWKGLFDAAAEKYPGTSVGKIKAAVSFYLENNS